MCLPQFATPVKTHCGIHEYRTGGTVHAGTERGVGKRGIAISIMSAARCAPRRPPLPDPAAVSPSSPLGRPITLCPNGPTLVGGGRRHGWPLKSESRRGACATLQPPKTTRWITRPKTSRHDVFTWRTGHRLHPAHCLREPAPIASHPLAIRTRGRSAPIAPTGTIRTPCFARRQGATARSPPNPFPPSLVSPSRAGHIDWAKASREADP